MCAVRNSAPAFAGPGADASRQRLAAQRNIEVHARLVAAVSAREVPHRLLAPGFCMENHAAAAVDHVYCGTSGWREWMSDLFEVFSPGARYRAEEVIAAGGDFVVASFCVEGSSVRSGNWLVFSWAGVAWFREGKAVRACGYSSTEAALTAVESRSRL